MTVLIFLLILYLQGYHYVMDSGKPSLYKRLGVPVYASERQIHKKSNEILRKYHPDSNQEKDKEDLFILY